jgi:very-short-patch-repair endonuclease
MIFFNEYPVSCLFRKLIFSDLNHVQDLSPFNRKLWPYQFNRQLIIGNYIVDFICRKLTLIIEIDGSSHFAKSEEDCKRQIFV